MTTPAPPDPAPLGAGPQQRSGPILTVEDLRRTFGGVAAVDGTSFHVAGVKITALIGPNGAGKSTVLNLIAGALRPDAGRIVFEGQDIAGEPAHQIAHRGIIRTFQLLGEFERLTVLENLLVGARPGRGDSLGGALLGKRYWRRSQDEQINRALSLLDRFGLRTIQHDYAGSLSGGQKRMVEIMRALMRDPPLLLLDEPFAGVSRALSGQVEQHLAGLREEGRTILMVEHELAAVDRLADAVVVMTQGRVLAEGSMADLRQNKEVLDAYLVG
jgi:neutral amino acid transport system ATP-binding protein